MDNKIEQFTVQEAEFMVRQLMKDHRYSSFGVFPSFYKSGLIVNHEKLHVPVGYEGTQHPVLIKLCHVKMIPYDRPHIARFSINERVFWKETNFYKMILPCLLYKYRQQHFVPRCILTSPSCLVLKDVKELGFKKYEIFNDLKLILSSIVTLARFHCTSIVAEALLTNRFNVHTTMRSRYVTGLEEMMFNDETTIGKWYGIGIVLTCTLAERLFEIKSKELRMVLSRLYNLVQPSDKHRNVICHGDLRKENMFFLQKRNGQKKCIFLNLYFVRYAPQVLDILQILYLHTSKAYRIEQENNILEVYHSKLIDTIEFFEDLPKDLKIDVPSLEEVKKALNNSRLFGPASASVYLSLSLIDSKFITDFIKYPKPPCNFLTEDILKICEYKLNANKHLKEQFKDLINEALYLNKNKNAEECDTKFDI